MEYIFDDIESCECIGEFEDEYVYDIEIDDHTHTFIANDILVHNSLYTTYTPLMASVGYKGDGLKFILHIYALHINKLFSSFLDEFAAKFGVKNIHDFELEKISKSGLFIEKKNYINDVVWEDGIFHETLEHFDSKGIEIIKSSSPPFVRDKMWDFVRYLFSDPDSNSIQDILKKIKEIKKEFMLAPIDDIALQTSLSNYKTKVIDDQSNYDCVKGAHFSVKAAAFHNYLLNKNSSYKTKYDTLKGGKIKWYFCKHPMSDRMAYMRSFHPTEICEKEGVEIDYDQQFYMCFTKILNRFLIPMNLPEVNKRLSVLNSLFGNKLKKTAVVEDDEDIFDDGEVESNEIEYDEFWLDDEKNDDEI